MSYPFVSVIIPVFNDAERLKTCLEALDRQTYPKDFYEVIVVDNGSDDNVEDAVNQFTQAKMATETTPGSYVARNKGLSLAKGEIIGFTDADCVPASDWIEKGVANLNQVSNCGIVGGKIEIFFQDPDRPTAVELYESITAFPQKNYVERDKFSVTANLWTFKKVIDKVGSFNSELKSGGDYEWGRRVFSAGYQLIFADDVVIGHPARASWKEMYKIVTLRAVGHYDLMQEGRLSYKRFVIDILRDLIPPVKFSFLLLTDKQTPALGIQQKVQVIYVRSLVKYTRAWEKCRSLIGFKKERR
jgi:glycosyltransferase involved in cell wall biosynthesis